MKYTLGPVFAPPIVDPVQLSLRQKWTGPIFTQSAKSGLRVGPIINWLGFTTQIDVLALQEILGLVKYWGT